MATWTRPTFRGNPRKTITAISTAGGIECSDTTLDVGSFLHVSAQNITATGTDIPYEDLEFLWTLEISDGGGGWDPVPDNEGLNNPARDEAFNPFTDQYGPEAVFPLRAAGTYRVTLACKGADGSGGVNVTETVTQEVTVNAFSVSGGEMWFDSVGGDDGNAGTEAEPKQTFGALKTFLEAADARSASLKGASSFAASTSELLLRNRIGLRISRYEAGDAPVLLGDGASTNSSVLYYAHASSSHLPENQVFSGVTFDGADTRTRCIFVFSASAGHVSRLYFDGCATQNCNLDLQIEGVPHNKIGLWNHGFLGGANNDSHVMLVRGAQWFMAVGGIVGGDGNNVTLDHHVYINDFNNVVLRGLPFQTATGRNYCLNANVAKASGNVEFWLVADCDMTGVQRAVDFSSTDNGRVNHGAFKNVAVEGNNIHGLAGDGVVLYYTSDTITFRDNVFWSNGGGRLLTVEDPASAFAFYANLMHQSTGSAMLWVNSSNDVLRQISDNWLVCTHETPRLLECSFSALATAVAAGAVVTGNKYWCPNATTSNLVYDTDTSQAKTIADLHTAIGATMFTEEDPGWADPANGDFSTEGGGDPGDPPAGVDLKKKQLLLLDRSAA